MAKKILSFIFTAIFLLNSAGCVAVVAGAAGGAGTAFWLEGKIKEEVKAPIPKVVKAVTSALKSMRLEITKTTVKDEVAQIKAEYTDKRVVWIDVKKTNREFVPD
jgi:hypothetical protein